MELLEKDKDHRNRFIKELLSTILFMMDEDFYQIRRSFINTYLDSPIIEGDAKRFLVEILIIVNKSDGWEKLIRTKILKHYS